MHYINVDAVALIPSEMAILMAQLHQAVSGDLVVYDDCRTFPTALREETCAVVLLPASIPKGDWWPVWGAIQSMEPAPSVVVYAEHSDFRTWAGVLECGAFDLAVMPLPIPKLSMIIEAAKADYLRRSDI